MARHAMYRSLNRSHSIGGGDMWAMFWATIPALSIWVAWRSLLGGGMAVALYSAEVAIIRILTKMDPHFMAVWWRSYRYQPYYPGRSGIHSDSRLGSRFSRWFKTAPKR